MKKIISISVLLLTQIAFAGVNSYNYPLIEDYKKYSCVFENTVIVGNSVSSGLMDFFDPKDYNFAGTTTKDLQKRFRARGSFPEDINGDSPARVLLDQYYGLEPKADISKGIGSLPTGGYFIQSFLNGENRAGEDFIQYRRASAIVGVDMFYMSAIFNECEYANFDNLISQFVNYAHANDTVLILGTIPEDNLRELRWLDDLFMMFEPKTQCSHQQFEVYNACYQSEYLRQMENSTCGGVGCSTSAHQRVESVCLPMALDYYDGCMSGKFDQIYSCRDQINAAIERHCRGEHCYKSDLKTIVSHLDNGGSYTLSDGRQYYKDDVRPNVNITEAGTQLIIENFMNNMIESADQPNCIAE